MQFSNTKLSVKRHRKAHRHRAHQCASAQSKRLTRCLHRKPGLVRQPQLRSNRQRPEDKSLKPATPAATVLPAVSLLPCTGDREVLDALNAVEDMLTRLTRLCPARVKVDFTGAVAVSFEGFRYAQWEGGHLSLRHAVLDVQSYAWHQNGQRGSLIHLLDYTDTRLIISFAAPVTLHRLPKGDTLSGFVQGFFCRMQARSPSC